MTYTRINPTPPTGDYYTAEWSATSSSAWGTQLTDKTAALPAGTYLVTVKFPTISTSSFLAEAMVGGQESNLYVNGPNYTTACFVTKVPAGAQLYLRAAQSSSATFSNTERGNLRATRLK